MNLDRSLLQKIHSLDDDTLRATIQSVAEGMGLDPSLTSLYLTDMNRIREKVSGLTPQDLEQVEQALGEENTRNLADRIRREVGEK